MSPNTIKTRPKIQGTCAWILNLAERDRSLGRSNSKRPLAQAARRDAGRSGNRFMKSLQSQPLGALLDLKSLARQGDLKYEICHLKSSKAWRITGFIWLLCVLFLGWSARADGVRLGNEVLADMHYAPLKGKRVGLITNPSGIDRRKRSTIDALRAAPGVKLVALFAPEHGLQGEFPAGREFPDSIDRRTGLPVYSLYGPGPTRKPTPAMLKNIDALVYDVQDTGCRSYTYISTLGLAMEACGEMGKEFVVLDRPNPVGGLRVEGPMLDPAFRSFIGQWQIPYLYGMTCGELARMIHREGWIRRACKLTIVPMKGWKRSMTWRHTGLPWIPTSPNIPHGDSPLYYPCTGFLGALGGVSIGIQYKRPFECVTAPWLDAAKLSRALNRAGLRGIRFHPYKTLHQGSPQRGIWIEFKDPARARLFAVNFYVLDAIRSTAGVDLYRDAAKAGRPFSLLDRVLGTDATRKALEKRVPAKTIVKSWQAGEDAFRKRRLPYLIYRD